MGTHRPQLPAGSEVWGHITLPRIHTRRQAAQPSRLANCPTLPQPTGLKYSCRKAVSTRPSAWACSARPSLRT